MERELSVAEERASRSSDQSCAELALLLRCLSYLLLHVGLQRDREKNKHSVTHSYTQVRPSFKLLSAVELNP